MAKAQQDKEPVEIPDTLKVDPEAFDNLPGDTFGGSSEILMLNEGDVAGPLTYVGHRLTDLGNGKQPADIHEAKDSEGATWRLPIATNFRRQAEGAQLAAGDTFYVKRLDDVVKKNGVGKGQMMQMYQIKVTVRAVRAA
jgi:hypothetical protein